MKLLIADDDPTNRVVLEHVLSRFGGVESCADGLEAVRAARLALAMGSPYDVICMDIMMPNMSGLEALQLIRQEEESKGRPKVSRIIVVTCREDGDTIDQAFGQLCDAYILKPIVAEQLAGMVEYLCDLHQEKLSPGGDHGDSSG